MPTFFPLHAAGAPVDIIILSCAVLTLYYGAAVLFLWNGLRRLKPSGEPKGLTYSVVIAARNEEGTIGRCLDSVFGQNLPGDRYEVIVVDDRSDDRTAGICEEYCRRYPALSLVRVGETPHGVAPKKYAVAAGIARAKNGIVVLTDADCIVPAGWLAAIDRNFPDAADVVQGITAYEHDGKTGRFFFGLQAVDFLSHGVVAAAAMGAGLPLNANANNFAFRRKVYESLHGYGSARKVVSGDDDLLLQRIAGQRPGNAVFMTDPAGAVATRPAANLRGLFEQRKRWGSKTVNYGPRQAVFLGGIFLFYCCIAAVFAAGFFSRAYFGAFLGMFAGKVAGEYLLMLPGTLLFNRQELRRYILPASFFHLPLVLAAVLGGVFGTFSWKGTAFRRTVR